MKLYFQIVLIAVISMASALTEEKGIYDEVTAKLERNKFKDFIAVASIHVDRDLESLSESPLLKSMVEENRFHVFPDFTTTLGISTLWCAPEDFEAVSKWLMKERYRFPEIKGLFKGRRFLFDGRDLETGHNKPSHSSPDRAESVRL